MNSESDLSDWDIKDSSDEDSKRIVIKDRERKTNNKEIDERELVLKLQHKRDVEVGKEMFGLEEEDLSDDSEMKNLLENKLIDKNSRVQHNKIDYSLMQLNRFSDLSDFCDAFQSKITTSPIKSQSWLIFLDRIIHACAMKMDLVDIETLNRKINTLTTESKKKENLKYTKAKKASDLKVNYKNYKEELDIYDGYDSESVETS